MPKFNKKKEGDLPAVSTASLPDIVFMLLFFFMTVTVMKDNSLLIQNELPFAEQIKKLDKKDRVITIYAGKPHERYQEIHGTETKIQLDDKLVSISAVAPYILEMRTGKSQKIQDLLTTALKIDSETNMGLITDIKQELRKVNALKINYVTKKGNSFENLP